MLRSRLLFACLAATMLSIPACAQSARPGEDPVPSSEDSTRSEAATANAPAFDPGRYIDWTIPFGADAPTFDSVAQVQQDLPFRVVEPTSWGTPETIQEVSPSQITDPTDEQVVLVYDLPAVGGPILLEEKMAGDYSLQVLKELAQAHASDPAVSDNFPSNTPGPFLSAFQMVDLRGTQGLLIQGNGIGRVMWIEGGVLFDIKGEAVSPDQVVKLAEGL